ncbi:MAG TPA: HlyD family efflux transporter periplasmic adaptor subunit [Bdellovibrionales bacterium]|nr:HlyD family efflux transporter periplasmic adaptor subunit [Bdellovibrionales bacterium]
MKRLFLSRRFMAFTAALMLAGALFGWLRARSERDENTFREVRVSRDEVRVAVTATATVQPDNRLEIKPPIGGRVESILIEEGASAEKGQVLAWLSSLERAALMDAARSKGPEELRRWEELYRPTPLLAPMSGTVILKNIEPGQSFGIGEPLLVMSNRLVVKAQVDETDLAGVKRGQAAEIVLDAYPEHPISGRVKKIAFEGKLVNNVTVYIVDVIPDHVPAFMRSGMTANVTFVIESKPDVLVLANDAITVRQRSRTVLLRAPSGEFVTRKIETGVSDGRNTEVVSGLAEGDVVLAPAYKPGAKKASSPLTPFERIRGAGGR